MYRYRKFDSFYASSAAKSQSSNMRALMIVESAAKAVTIKKYLSSIAPSTIWTVSACLGHVRDLPLKELGVDTDNWTVTYQAVPGKNNVISKLKKLASDSDVVYLASDPDLEGHAIAEGLVSLLKLSREKCIRVTFHEITKTALKAALENPSGWEPTKVQAQETRRVLDRLVGYKISPLLWKYVRSGTSAGRVQSCALAMVRERYKKYTDHEPEISWSFHGSFEELKAVEDNLTTHSLDDTMTHMRDIVKNYVESWAIDIKVTVVKKAPPLPFTTCSLQQEAYANHRISAKTTMNLAQALYEEGFITYMRTDCCKLSEDSVFAIGKFVKQTYGEEYHHMRKGNKGASLQANASAQEAHEAIRPSNVSTSPENVTFKTHKLVPLHVKLYELIWKRTVATQMAPAVYNEYTFKLTHTHTDSLPKYEPECESNCPYTFSGSASVMTFEGYRKIYGATPDSELQQKWETLTTQCKEGRLFKLTHLLAQCDVTQPKRLYSETDLIKAMEKNGIGRPSTYVTIIDKLLSKGYVSKDGNCDGSEKTIIVENLEWDGTNAISEIKNLKSQVTIGGNDKDRLIPQPLGIDVLAYLEKRFADLLETGFTADWERKLDDIENGKDTKEHVLEEFYGSFHRKLQDASSEDKKNYAASLTHKNQPKHLNAFLKWRGRATTYGKSVSDQEMKALHNLPYNLTSPSGKVEGSILLGPYGLYVRTLDKKNTRLPPKLWCKVVDGTISWSDFTS